MIATRQTLVRTGKLAIALLATASLAACATATPRYAARSPHSSTMPSSVTPGQQPSGAGGIYKVGQPYQVGGIWYVPREQPDYEETGIASWYGPEFHMKPTANGETFDMATVSAAHTTLPLPSIVEVTNLENGRKLNVRVNDRGPFVGGRVIDLSKEAARQLGYDQKGTAQVRVRYVGPAPLNSVTAPPQYAANTYGSSPAPYATGAAANRPFIVTPSTPPDEPLRPAVAAPAAVASSSLPPLKPAVTPAGYASTGVYKVQAGAYGDQANAQRAVAQLSGAGNAVIEPVAHNGMTLYRVMLVASADEGQAWALRDVVAGYGFADARVVRPF